MDEIKLNPAEQVRDDKIKERSTGQTTKTEVEGMNQKSKTSSTTEQDLDVFLLGDLGDSDEDPGMASALNLLARVVIFVQ